MQTITVLILDERDVCEHKRHLKAGEITIYDIIYPAYGFINDAYGVIFRMNGTEKVMKNRASDKRVVIYESHLD
jgi:hypothetical protein